MEIKKLLECINEINIMKGEMEIKNIELSTSLRKDLGFDSIDLATLTAKIEDVYNVDIFENGIIDTVGEIIGMFEGKK